MKLLQSKNPGPEVIELAANIIKNGGLVVLPFDTVYGIVCDPSSKEAVSKLFKFKQRPKTQTLGLCFTDIAIATKYVDLDKNQFEYASTKLPGKITLIAKAKSDIQIDPRCQRGETAGFRVPDSELIIAITKSSGGALAQTSANKHGVPNCFSLDDIKSQFSGSELEQIDLIVDGGLITSDGASQIIDLTVWPPKTIERS